MSIETMEGLSAQYAEDFGNHDLGAPAQHYLDGALVLAPGIDTIDGRQVIGAFLQSMVEAGIGWIDIEPYAHEQDGTLGVEIGNHTMRHVRGGAVVDVGRYLSVRRRQADGTWRIRTDISNSTQPAK